MDKDFLKQIGSFDVISELTHEEDEVELEDIDNMVLDAICECYVGFSKLI